MALAYKKNKAPFFAQVTRNVRQPQSIAAVEAAASYYKCACASLEVLVQFDSGGVKFRRLVREWGPTVGTVAVIAIRIIAAILGGA